MHKRGMPFLSAYKSNNMYDDALNKRKKSIVIKMIKWKTSFVSNLFCFFALIPIRTPLSHGQTKVHISAKKE